MVGTIVGFENIQYFNKEGKEITGIRLYYTYEDDNCNGKCCDTVYIPGSSSAYIDKVELNRKYEFNYQVTSFTGKARLISVKPV